MSLAQLGYAVLGPLVVVLWWARSSAVHAALLGWCVMFVAAVTLIMPAWSPDDLDLVLRFFGVACAAAAVLGGTMWYFGPRRTRRREARVTDATHRSRRPDAASTQGLRR